MFRRLALCTAAALALLAPGRAPAQTAPLPKTIPLPAGFQPEGIARGPGARAFVGTLNGGGVIDVNVQSGATRFLVQPRPERMAAGVAYSPRANAVFVCGAFTGTAFVYDADSGRELAALRLSAQNPTFVNDVVLTSQAAFLTDSMRPVLYRVPLAANGLPTGAIEEIPLGPPFRFQPGRQNTNGIESIMDGRFLLSVSSASGELFRIDPARRQIARIDLGGASLVNGDGIRLEGNTLLVVQNLNNQISEIELNSDWTAGVLRRTLREPGLDTPTTVASFDGVLFVVNPRFNDVPVGRVGPRDVFNVLRVDRPLD